MKLRFFYGMKPDIKDCKVDDFSQKEYRCHALFQTRRGTPVLVSQHKELDIWKVQHGFSTIHFGTKEEAIAYCKGRFYDTDGKAV